MSKQQDQLLKQYDAWNKEQFKALYRKWEQIYSRSTSFEEYVAYLYANDLLDVEEYSAKINNIINVDLNQLSFNRKAQEELTKQVISQQCYDLVQNVNDDFREHLRTEAQRAFSEGVSPQEFGKMIQAPPLIKGVNGAKRSIGFEARNRMIARTESKRALNTSNYLINKERGATHWYAVGFDDENRCMGCIETYGTSDDPVYYPIDDASNLPPLHPNCRCSAVFVKRDSNED